ncbi:response regulator [Myxococcus sp. MISCRS1]|jgi:CheY-like chemotaxis protein|uniref:Response regulator receiver domain-containing protein n=1 Tax=Myxococcus fulvus TaxID=33 RepID=A0A511TGG6_MYXFU|nr:MULTISPECIES: response regulator [Myxococcus]AKF80464.1 chemotaxis protein CheY [Myxococcus fulvus 124B02]BDT32752.1 response regulator [Myxococcus sp. MH1]MBZ4400488.1 response regulator [Myxococcus sp. AS-1-15]MBZ4412938.1 response regulator [Myxococcus sp. XM-1-1-1]MCK8501230.1 response regulator [Myxococcus fulvus]
MSLPTTEELIPVLGPDAKERTERSDELKVEPVRSAVLVVEDDPSHREILVEMLAGWGYEPLPVGSAEEAEFAVRNKRMDAAIVDVFLPGRSGATLMSRLRERFPQAVLIGVSAMSDSAMARKCKGLGADLFIGKPLNPERLSEALQSKHTSWH